MRGLGFHKQGFYEVDLADGRSIMVSVVSKGLPLRDLKMLLHTSINPLSSKTFPHAYTSS